MKSILRLAPILALAACATTAPQKPTAVDTGKQETREEFFTFQLNDEVDEAPDPEMEELMGKIADEIRRAQATVEKMRKALDDLGLPLPPEPIPDEIIPNDDEIIPDD